jgi:hypothetical protein
MKNLLLIVLISCVPEQSNNQNVEDTSYAVMNIDHEIIYVNDDVAEDADELIENENLKHSIVVKPYPDIIFNGPAGSTRCTFIDNMTSISNEKNKSEDVIYGWEESYTAWGIKVLIPAVCYYNNNEAGTK